jgi:hypothetical protein
MPFTVLLGRHFGGKRVLPFFAAGLGGPMPNNMRTYEFCTNAPPRLVCVPPTTVELQRTLQPLHTEQGVTDLPASINVGGDALHIFGESMTLTYYLLV